VAHFIAQELLGDGLHHWIAAAQGQQAEINFGDEFGGEEHLNVELQIHQIAQPAEDGVRPLLLQQRSAQMFHRSRE